MKKQMGQKKGGQLVLKKVLGQGLLLTPGQGKEARCGMPWCRDTVATGMGAPLRRIPLPHLPLLVASRPPTLSAGGLGATPTALEMMALGARRAGADLAATPGGTSEVATGPQEAPDALPRGAGASRRVGRGGGPVPQTVATRAVGLAGLRPSLPPYADHPVLTTTLRSQIKL